MDEICKKCKKEYKEHWFENGHPYCHFRGSEEFESSIKTENVPVGFVDAVRELLEAGCYTATAEDHARYIQAAGAIRSLLNQIDGR